MLRDIESVLPAQAEDLIARVIGAVIRVHSMLGPGVLERIYSNALAIELDFLKIPFERGKAVTVSYRGHTIAGQRLDFVVDNTVILEIKAAARMDPIFQAKLISYLRATGLKVGLLINFNVPLARDGIKRIGSESAESLFGVCVDNPCLSWPTASCSSCPSWPTPFVFFFVSFVA